MNGLDFSKLTVKDIELVISVKGKAGGVVPHAEASGFRFCLPRKDHGLVLIQKGKSRYVFENGAVLETSRGALVYLPRGEGYYVETLEDVECICVNFSVFENISGAPMIYYPKNYSRWEELYETLLRVWRYPAPGYAARCKSLLYDMLASIEEERQAKYLSKDKKQIIENAIFYMEEEFRQGNNVDIPRLAAQCNMSSTYFRRLFRGIYGVSPKQYILSVRMRWARTMLKSTENSITKIAENCGFDNVYYFSRAFRIHEGISPSEYRNQYKEIEEKRNG